MSTEAAPAISVIIPCYKVEKWVRRTWESLDAQTFKDFEVIFVDDGGPDNTGAILDELAGTDSRIRVIHQANAGAAKARNNAMVLARGKYDFFMDADDWCEPTMLEDLYTFCEANDLQVAVTGFFIDTYYDADKFYREVRTAPDAVYATQADFRAAAPDLFDRQLLYAPWNKLYRRDFLTEGNIFFPATFWDDLPFNLEVFRDVERVGCLNNRYYHFLRAREESENTKYRADMYNKREEENGWMRELFAYWGIDTPESREFLARRYAERLIGCVENVTNKNCTLTKAEKRAAIKKMISTPQARASLAIAHPKSGYMKLMLKPLQWQNVTLTMWQSSFISFVKRNNTNLFARLKANR
ncbi:MAG: glycosyltransferase [Eggerthellaceae bacterium]|nr:glycosyltransferase [Eggerthellaceae bacterium]